ncbi:MAG TPA: Wzz/FepE/Etk N-terminal domain-containing protein [Xanthobacteraceae bacterium]|jgi:capsular exopolysaccharide synthesis family protein
MLLSKNSSGMAEDVQEIGPRPISAADAVASAFRFLQRRRSIIILVLLLSVGTGILYLFIAIPKFTSQAVLLIDPNRVSREQQTSGPTDTQADSFRLQSQIEVLKSEKVALAVINALQLTRDAEFVGPDRSGAFTVGLTDALSDLNTAADDSNYRLIRRAVKRFEDRLSVKRREGSYAVQINFQSTDPKQAALIANTVVDAYIADQMDARYEATRRAANWLQDRIKKLRAQLSAGAQSSNAGNPGGHGVDEDRVTELNIQSSQLQVASQTIQQQPFPISEARVITEATPPLLPSSPKPMLVLALTGLGGALLGMAAGMLLDGLDRTFRTMGQVSRELGTDCIGVIPARPMLTERRPARRSRLPPPGTRIIGPEQSPIWRINSSSSPDLRGGIHSISAVIESLKRRGNQNQIVGLTSVLAREGKSTIAAGVSELMASQGARTILVDCDLLHPWLSSILSPAPERGLFEVISGASSVDEISWTDPVTGLVFLPSAKTPRPIKSSTLTSYSVRQLFTDLRKAYDFMIIDLPIMSQLADIPAVTDEIDSFILIIEWGKTNMTVVRRALSLSRTVHETLLGAVLNKVDMKALTRYDA